MRFFAILVAVGALEAAERPNLAARLRAKKLAASQEDAHSVHGGIVEVGPTQKAEAAKPGIGAKLLRARADPSSLVHATVDRAMKRKGRPAPPPPPPAPPPPPHPPAGCQIGDGTGGHEEHIANHIGSMMDCKNFVRTHRPHANGATWGFRNHRCYAEYNQNGVGGDHNNWMNCPVAPVPSGCQNGDGTGGPEKYLTNTNTMQECRDFVAQNQPSANGATWGPDNKYCYAEWVQSGVHFSLGWMNCPVSALPAGCVNGDGTGGGQKQVSGHGSQPNIMACVAYVRQMQPSANGATWSPQTMECYAEFGQTGYDSGQGAHWVNCAITPGTAHFGAGECTNGDGNGAYEVKVGTGIAQMAGCKDEVQKEHPAANGATWEPANGGCWAEYGQSGAYGGGSTMATYRNCPLTPIAPEGCRAGTGNGADESMGMTATVQECIDKVSVHEPSANGMTWDPGSQNCNAEIEQTEATGSGPIVNCPIHPIAPTGCSEGEGSGGLKAPMPNTQSMHECIDVVKVSQPAANGASWSPATLKCNAEFDQAGTEGTGHDWVNCPVEPICEPGDGQGSSETFALKTDTIFECTDYVKANFPSANGATWGVSNKNCFAEFEQNGTDGADKWLNCPLVPTVTHPTFPPLPNVTCEPTTGDGSGPSSYEDFADLADSMQACANRVADKFPAANGATYSNESKKCYAEYGQVEVSPNSDWNNCYLKPPPAPTLPPCTDATHRRDLAYMSKMDVLKANEDLVKQAADLKREIQDLRNVYSEHEATHARVKVKFNSTDAFCNGRKAQLDAHERWVEAEMAHLKSQCDRADGLSSQEFQELLTKVLDAVQRKLE